VPGCYSPDTGSRGKNCTLTPCSYLLLIAGHFDIHGESPLSLGLHGTVGMAFVIGDRLGHVDQHLVERL
jgi:hypothetical protein